MRKNRIESWLNYTSYYDKVNKLLIKISILSNKFYETKRIAYIYQQKEYNEYNESEQVIYLNKLQNNFGVKIHIEYPVYEYECEDYDIDKIMLLMEKRKMQLKCLVSKYTDYSDNLEVKFNNNFQSIDSLEDLVNEFHIFVCRRCDILNNL